MNFITDKQYKDITNYLTTLQMYADEHNLKLIVVNNDDGLIVISDKTDWDDNGNSPNKMGEDEYGSIPCTQHYQKHARFGVYTGEDWSLVKKPYHDVVRDKVNVSIPSNLYRMTAKDIAIISTIMDALNGYLYDNGLQLIIFPHWGDLLIIPNGFSVVPYCMKHDYKIEEWNQGIERSVKNIFIDYWGDCPQFERIK